MTLEVEVILGLKLTVRFTALKRNWWRISQVAAHSTAAAGEAEADHAGAQ